MVGSNQFGAGLNTQQRAQAQRVLDGIKEQITIAQGAYPYLKREEQAVVGLAMAGLMNEFIKAVKRGEEGNNRQSRTR